MLLEKRKYKMEKALGAVESTDFETARKLVSEIFHGEKIFDPGMEGSLLYHMAMVTKMEAESRLVLEELKLEEPNLGTQLKNFFDAFASDVKELVEKNLQIEVNPEGTMTKAIPSEKEKIILFNELTEKTNYVEGMLRNHNPEVERELRKLFLEWTKKIVDMRLRQEYETIRGFLIIANLIDRLGIEHVEKAVTSVQEEFGKETVGAALNVTLKVGIRREKLQSIMLSDHYTEYRMNMTEREGFMRFLNCPIFGSHRYLSDKLGIENEVQSLFCRHFCFAHAKAMFDSVLPFPFELSQPRRMAADGKCEFYLKLAHASNEISEKFVPLVISWNVTANCNLKCAHCYINAGEKKAIDELSTDAAKMLIHQIAEVSKPLVILSGGEPLLRKDIFELIRYGRERGLKMAMGSNGTLIDDDIARKLKNAGITTVSISLDSSKPELHDEFRGVTGAWKGAVEAIKALRRNNIITQVNTTVTKQNYDEIDEIMTLAEKLGVENYHLFFLVPTGRETRIEDISPDMYEKLIKSTFSKSMQHNLNVKPSCAPQFMRIAKETGIDMKRWVRGCMAGLYYCCVYPTGEVTPCPYLPIKLGNIREKSFKEIWFNSEILRNLRDPKKLKGKCGKCEYNEACGGCRARAYGLTSDFIDFCGDLHEPTGLHGDYLAEEPWCTYKPRLVPPASRNWKPKKRKIQLTYELNNTVLVDAVIL
jgi:radical SAM protein with 4Fe4S-binding SPASM domain